MRIISHEKANVIITFKNMAEKKCEIKCAEYSCSIIGYAALKEEQRLVI